MKRKFGILGKDIQYSFSPQYFKDKFLKENITDAIYEMHDIDSIEEVNQVFKTKDLVGFNVTIPYKEKIIDFLDELSPEAEVIGAVNTVLIQNGKKIGHNTDWIGFKNSIKPFLELGQERALILGTGGAAKAVEYVLREIGISVYYLTRSPKKENEYSYDDCNDIMLNSCKIIINTTPLGGVNSIDSFPLIDYSYITDKHLCYDLIYSPSETLFLKKCKAQDALTVNGLSMLKIQAEAAWKIWN